MKKHETIPNEPQENPPPQPKPEINRPNDPNEPHAPREGDENIPVELPPLSPPNEGAPINPNTY